MSAAIVGALFGPVLGGIASVIGIEVAFAAVAVLGLVLAVWAALTPAAKPEQAQPLSMLWAAMKDRAVLGSVWFVALPALLFSTMGVLVVAAARRARDERGRDRRRVPGLGRASRPC